MRFFDFMLVSFITAALAAVIVVFHEDAMPYPVSVPGTVAPPPARAWAGIWIHSSGSRSGSAASIDKAHASRGGLPFHFVIGNGSETGDGEVEECFRWKHQRPGLNPDVIEICLVGEIDRERPTRKQIQSLDQLLLRLCRERLIPASEIYAESEKRPGVACPGRNFSPAETRSVIRGLLAK